MANNRVELKDAELENVSGGVHVEDGYVYHENGTKYKCKVSGYQAYLFAMNHGYLDDDAMIALMKQENIIE